MNKRASWGACDWPEASGFGFFCSNEWFALQSFFKKGFGKTFYKKRLYSADCHWDDRLSGVLINFWSCIHKKTIRELNTKWPRSRRDAICSIVLDSSSRCNKYRYTMARITLYRKLLVCIPPCFYYFFQQCLRPNKAIRLKLLDSGLQVHFFFFECISQFIWLMVG